MEEEGIDDLRISEHHDTHTGPAVHEFGEDVVPVDVLGVELAGLTRRVALRVHVLLDLVELASALGAAVNGPLLHQPGARELDGAREEVEHDGLATALITVNDEGHACNRAGHKSVQFVRLCVRRLSDSPH